MTGGVPAWGDGREDERAVAALRRRPPARRACETHLARVRRVRSQVLPYLRGETVMTPLGAEPSAVAGRAVRDVAWPRHTLLTSVRRGGDLIMPNGATPLRAGDVIGAIVQEPHGNEVRGLPTGTADTGEDQEADR